MANKFEFFSCCPPVKAYYINYLDLSVLACKIRMIIFTLYDPYVKHLIHKTFWIDILFLHDSSKEQEENQFLIRWIEHVCVLTRVGTEANEQAADRHSKRNMISKSMRLAKSLCLLGQNPGVALDWTYH